MSLTPRHITNQVGISSSPPLGYLAFPFQKKIAVFFLVVVVVLGVIFFVLNKNRGSLTDTAHLVEHTNQVLLQNQRILNLTRDLETGAMRYIITGDENFLTPFITAQLLIHPAIEQLRKLTNDNSLQNARIDSLQIVIENNIKVRQQLIDLRRKEGADAADRLFATGVTKIQMDKFREMIAGIERDEEKLLAERKANNLESISDSARVISGLEILVIFLLLAGLIIIYSNTRSRSKAEEKIRQLNQQLEQRVAEKTTDIIEKEKQYRFLLQNMQEGIQVIGFDWRYLFVNNSLMLQTEQSRTDELTGFTMMEKYPGIENTELFKVLQCCMTERKAELIENEFIFNDGKRAWFELSIQPVPEGLFILSMDISKRKKTEQALKESEEKYHLMFESNPLPMWVLDTESIGFLDVNNAALVHYGFTREEFLQLKATDIRPESERARFLTNVRPDPATVYNAGKWRHKKKDGSIIMVEIFAHPLIYAGKNARLILINDITDRLKIEGEILREKDLIEELNLTLEKRAAELANSNTELERFAYVASHDLQEPLRMVSSFLHLLEKKLVDQLDESSRRYIEFAVDGAERMKKLIQDLLEYSRVGSNQANVANVNCNEVMDNVCSLYNLSIHETNAVILVKPLPHIRAVQQQVQQLFQNLIGNALKYKSEEAPKIEVGCIEQDTAWEFYIKDNGIGIEPQFFDKIFIIFQRLHNRTEYSGTGIGLAICKKIVERHGGRIWVEAAPGKGSIFYFTIKKNKDHERDQDTIGRG